MERTDIIISLIDSLNVMGCEDEAVEDVVNTLYLTHRTLQASFIRVMLTALSQYGNTAHYDGRNEAAVIACRNIQETVSKSYIPFI
jgi:hypothetical protein